MIMYMYLLWVYEVLADPPDHFSHLHLSPRGVSSAPKTFCFMIRN
jgi:hypothetical protein